MTIRIDCPGCGRECSYDDGRTGRMVTCTRCYERFLLDNGFAGVPEHVPAEPEVAPTWIYWVVGAIGLPLVVVLPLFTWTLLGGSKKGTAIRVGVARLRAQMT